MIMELVYHRAQLMIGPTDVVCQKKIKNRTPTIQMYPIQLLLVEMALKLLEYRPSVPEIKWTRGVCHIRGSTYGLDVIHGSGWFGLDPSRTLSANGPREERVIVLQVLYFFSRLVPRFNFYSHFFSPCCRCPSAEVLC